MATGSDIDFAYKYPFSEAARRVVKDLGPKSIDLAQLGAAKDRVDQAIKNSTITYVNVGVESIKTDYVLGYAYARMLVSAMKSPLAIKTYSAAEARRSAGIMEGENDEGFMGVCAELGIGAKPTDGAFSMKLPEFLGFSPKGPDFDLVNQRLRNGEVTLDRHKLVRVAEVAMIGAIERGLPIDPKAIPKPVLDAARGISRPVIKSTIRYASGSGGWIEKLLQTPIPDCRHRTVNLILAPYFTNVKGMSVDDATKAINDYINLCKTINPNTNITERYIHYQCQYAKTHEMRPLALKRAKDELFSSLDLDIFGDMREVEGKAVK